MPFFFLIRINQYILSGQFFLPLPVGLSILPQKMREVLDMACISYMAIILLFQEYSYCLVLQFWGWLTCLKSRWRTHRIRYSRESSNWVTLSLPRGINKWFLVSPAFENSLSFPLFVLWQREIPLQARCQEVRVPTLSDTAESSIGKMQSLPYEVAHF